MSRAYTASGAVMSPCGTYRYQLWREWRGGCGLMVVVGLNPSTADADQDDPTIRRCVAFAKREGCCGLVMLNLFALRSTDPKALGGHIDPRGPDNGLHLAKWLHVPQWMDPLRDFRVAAWGAAPDAVASGRKLSHDFPGLRCFGTTKHGHPRHPLYLREDAALVPWEPTP